MVTKQELLQSSLVQMMSYLRNITLKKSKRSSKAVAKNTMKAKGSEASLAWPEHKIELWKYSNQSSIFNFNFVMGEGFCAVKTDN